MALFEVLDERMKIVQLETTTRVITALREEEVSQELDKALTLRPTMSSSRPTMLRAFNREPLSLSMLELRRVALKSVGLEGKEDEVRESYREMGLYIRPRAEQPVTNGCIQKQSQIKTEGVRKDILRGLGGKCRVMHVFGKQT